MNLQSKKHQAWANRTIESLKYSNDAVKHNCKILTAGMNREWRKNLQIDAELKKKFYYIILITYEKIR